MKTEPQSACGCFVCLVVSASARVSFALYAAPAHKIYIYIPDLATIVRRSPTD